VETPDYERIESDGSFRQLALQERSLRDSVRVQPLVRR